MLLLLASSKIYVLRRGGRGETKKVQRFREQRAVMSAKTMATSNRSSPCIAI